MSKREHAETLEFIGRRVHQRRKELGLTQESLAESVNVVKSFVSAIEHGETQASGLVYLKLAQALEVSVQWLLTGAERTTAQSAPSPDVPPLVSRIAEEKHWSYKQTLDVAAALGAIVARRTKAGQAWEPNREYVLRIAKAVFDEGES
jgi:DNA-binding XRE family transcriptional regulator